MARSRTSRLKLWRWSDDTDAQMRTDFDTDNDQLESLVAIASNGTRAARPAPGVRDRLYFASDEQALYYDSGSAWFTVVTKTSMPTDTVYTAAAQTLTGKVIDGTANTLQNIPAAALTGLISKARLPTDTVYTTTAQTLTGKVISGLVNTLQSIPAAALTGLVAKANLPADTVYGVDLKTGLTSLTFNASGEATLTHGAGFVPVYFGANHEQNTGADIIQLTPKTNSLTSTSVVLVARTDAGAAYTGSLSKVRWIAAAG